MLGRVSPLFVLLVFNGQTRRKKTMTTKNKNQIIGPMKPKTTPKRRMTEAEEDSFLDEFSYLPNNKKTTPAETRLIQNLQEVTL